MTLVSECLGVARSQLAVRIKQSVSPKVQRSRPVDDAESVVEIQQQVSEMPCNGYRRVWGLLRHTRETQLLSAINVNVEKRFGDQLPTTPVQWLRDNVSAYSSEQTRLFARRGHTSAQPAEQWHGRAPREGDQAGDVTHI